jgi:hypothetical protein
MPELLDARGDPKTVASWVAEVQFERRAAEPQSKSSAFVATFKVLDLRTTGSTDLAATVEAPAA